MVDADMRTSAPPAEIDVRAEVTARQGRDLRSRSRRWFSTILVVLACITSVVAVTAGWLRYTLVNTDRFVSTVAPLASDPEVQAAVSRQLTTQLMTLIDADEYFERVLPERGQLLVVPLTGAVQRFVGDRVDEFVASDRFATMWENAVRVAHVTAKKVVRGDADVPGLTTQGNQVVVDLVPAINAVVQRIAEESPALFRNVDVPELTRENVGPPAERLAAALGVTLKPGFGTFPVFDKRKLDTAQETVKQVDRLTLALLVLAPALAIAAVLVSKNRRRTLLVIGIGVALGMVVARRLTLRVNHELVALVADPVNRAATDATTGRVLAGYLDLLAFIIIGSVVVAVIAWLVGPARAARRVRTKLAATRAEGSGSGSAAGWLVTYRDAVRIAVAAIGVIVLLFVDVSWAAVFIVVGAVAVVEVILTGLRASSPLGPGDARAPAH